MIRRETVILSLQAAKITSPHLPFYHPLYWQWTRTVSKDYLCLVPVPVALSKVSWWSSRNL
jgi:hypothetical protein